MRHRKSGKILGRRLASRRSLLRQLAGALILNGRTTTTVAKAKALRPFVERLITRSRTKSLSVRRNLIASIGNERAVRKLLSDIGPRYATRPGGYTRLMRLPRRQGDASPKALIELVP